MKGKSIVAWQNCPSDLNNPQFTALVNSGVLNYSENPLQENQVKYFLSNRAEVIIIDKTILRYWTKVLKESMNLKNDDIDFDYHKIFPGLTSLYVGFRDKDLMMKFDAALTQMKQDGTYNKIIESYVTYD